MLATSKGKEYALTKLRERRQKNEGREPFDNGSLYAGQPMYFPCDACGDNIRHPEDYLTRVRLCAECQALKELDWLNE